MSPLAEQPVPAPNTLSHKQAVAALAAALAGSVSLTAAKRQEHYRSGVQNGAALYRMLRERGYRGGPY